MFNDSGDPWSIGGDVDKSAIWSFYVIANALGVVLNAGAIAVILRSRNRTAGDILFVGLCSGCLLMSAPCASQCAINLVYGRGRFEYGAAACWYEAFFHVSAIMVQFFSIALIAFHRWLLCEHRAGLTNEQAWICLVVMWTLGELGTYVSGDASAIRLLPAGAYCFYDFTSPTIVYWFAPMMVLTLLAAAYFYWRIFRLPLELTGPAAEKDALQRRIARNSVQYLLAYLFGWFPAVIACVYALSTGSLTVFLDTFLAIFGSFNSDWQPLVYGAGNVNIRKFFFKRVACCRRCCPELAIVRLRGDHTVVGRTNPEAAHEADIISGAKNSRETGSGTGDRRDGHPSGSSPDSPGRTHDWARVGKRHVSPGNRRGSPGRRTLQDRPANARTSPPNARVDIKSGTKSGTSPAANSVVRLSPGVASPTDSPNFRRVVGAQSPLFAPSPPVDLTVDEFRLGSVDDVAHPLRVIA